MALAVEAPIVRLLVTLLTVYAAAENNTLGAVDNLGGTMKAIAWTAIAIVFWCTSALLIIALQQVPWPATWEDYADTKPFVEVLALTLTPFGAIGALIGVGATWLASSNTLRQAIKGERATRFQKGTEMLSSDKEPAVLGGVTLIEQVAMEDLETYSIPALKAFGAAVYAADRKLKWEMAFFFEPARQPPFAGSWIPSAVGSAEAISAALRVAHARWPVNSDLLDDLRLYLANAYLADKTFPHERFDHVKLQRAILNGVRFTDCTFVGADIHAVLGLDVTFERCNFANARLKLLDSALQPVQPTQVGRLRIIDSTNIEGASINGVPAAEWLREHLPPPAAAQNR